MPEIISNTTCIMVLDNAGSINILRELYGTITITEEVFQEFGKVVPDWIKVVKVKNSNYTKILEQFMDLGEASTIALNIETENSKMIIDDMKARKFSNKMNLNYTGTVGVLLRAKECGIIKNITEILTLLKLNGFRISEEVERKALILAGEFDV
jgi:predicted nucleic acid-binding protein